ncbi:VOC family virulence protein [Iamia sp. SCSIO 61187]|uniref:VOC family protein n=1 Tax=Iamia sp. SCSIO 61187 TaxID=2722752 RepID=UPI001C62E12E|nr:VOC family protein [Iamia sp. SCSIO 61187]QYG91394.1 VOC family virulence protein [Iamia sp. SCSIO 61187]
MSAPLTVTGIDHLVLQVPDVAPVVAWYRDELGLAVEREEEFARGEAIFVTLRIDATTIIDVLPGERTGENVNHVALVVDADVDALAASGRFVVESGPADLSGAQGQGRGIYIRDPAGNLVELRSY